jgi:hypothetical protein
MRDAGHDIEKRGPRQIEGVEAWRGTGKAGAFDPSIIPKDRYR